ncbi:hypothetical protein FRC08_014571 [Ceratobasidium sp. 394]|nr:hypothetical protein FRC08_014571 [Ceratobasidium sp. 394]
MCFEHFQTLPYTVQEHIIDLTDDFQTFLALAMTSKYLSTLSSRSLYARLDFAVKNIGKKRWPSLQEHIQISNVRYLQRTLVSNLTQHPHLGIFTRSLSWEILDDYSWSYGTTLPTKKVWAAFETLNAVHTVDLKVRLGNEEPPPEAPLFPNLQVARIEGVFPKGSLEKILHTSPYLRELRIVGKDTAEHKAYCRSFGTDITSFLQRSIDDDVFPRLRVLELCFSRAVRLDVVAQFLSILSGSLVELSLELTDSGDQSNEVFATHFLPLFQGGSWQNLRLLQLTDIPVSSDDIDILATAVPLCQRVMRSGLRTDV